MYHMYTFVASKWMLVMHRWWSWVYAPYVIVEDM